VICEQGAITLKEDFEAAYQLKMGRSPKLVIDPAVLHSFGFQYTGSFEHICRFCKQKPKGYKERCCDMYDSSKRMKKVLIYNMKLECLVTNPVACFDDY
jgi:hypothetical protein